MRGLLACPVGAVGYAGPKLSFSEVFPQELMDGVFYCGFNSAKSFGANSFFVRRGGGNLLVDSPRYVIQLVRRFEDMGGIADILLTHRDDVADADRYARRFGARVWIHEADRDAAPYATDVISGNEARAVGGGMLAIPIPGHTRGSVAYLLDSRFLFTGDSLYWDRDADDLNAFRWAAWYSWPVQVESLARLAKHSFEWVLAGHGDRRGLPASEMHARLVSLLGRIGQS